MLLNTCYVSLPHCCSLQIAFFIDEEKVNVNQPDAAYGTPLHYAASQGHEDMTIYLLQQGANPFAVDNFANTPIELAFRHGRGPVATILEHVMGISASNGHYSVVGTYIPPHYCMLPHQRRVLLFINPCAGDNQLAIRVYQNVIQPLLSIAAVHATIVRTFLSSLLSV